MELVYDVTIVVRVDTNKQTYSQTFSDIAEASAYLREVLERVEREGGVKG